MFNSKQFSYTTHYEKAINRNIGGKAIVILLVVRTYTVQYRCSVPGRSNMGIFTRISIMYHATSFTGIFQILGPEFIHSMKY